MDQDHIDVDDQTMSPNRETTQKTNMFQIGPHQALSESSPDHHAYGSSLEAEEQCRLEMEQRHSKRSVRFGESSPEMEAHDSEDPSDQEMDQTMEARGDMGTYSESELEASNYDPRLE